MCVRVCNQRSREAALLSSLDRVQGLLDLGGVPQVDLENLRPVGAGVPCALDVPLLPLEGPDDLSTEQAGGAGDQGRFARHISSVGR